MMEKQMRQRAHLQSFIDRFKAQASKARQAQSRIKALARMARRAPPPSSPSSSARAQPAADHGRGVGRLPQHRRHADRVREDHRVRHHFRCRPDSASACCINGAGKSTFIKTIAGELQSLAGDTQFNKGLSIGYFAQHQVEMLRHDESPLWHMTARAQCARAGAAQLPGQFHFNGAMATSPITPFSGGEKARLALALIVWQRPNLLLLDEPTNHLDLKRAKR